MNSPRVILTVVNEDTPSEQYVFDEPSACVIGRARDCDIQLLAHDGHLDVSRHHCLLEIDPPQVLVRDLCSLNGTFVNGRRIGQRFTEYLADHDCQFGFPALELKDGDVLQIGTTTIRAGVRDAIPGRARMLVG